MADLKTTAGERAIVRSAVAAWPHDDAISATAALDDLDTLLAENAKLWALCLEATAHVGMPGLTITPAEHDLRARLLAALGAP